MTNFILSLGGAIVVILYGLRHFTFEESVIWLLFLIVLGVLGGRNDEADDEAGGL
jgi:hypothetical protein